MNITILSPFFVSHLIFLLLISDGQPILLIVLIAIVVPLAIVATVSVALVIRRDMRRRREPTDSSKYNDIVLNRMSTQQREVANSKYTRTTEQSYTYRIWAQAEALKINSCSIWDFTFFFCFIKKFLNNE